jgi:hypothetical protein
MPDVSGLWVDLMQQCGLCGYDSGRPVPLTYQEIDAWSRVGRIELAGYEAEVMRKLSEHYCISWARARIPSCPDPANANPEAALDAFKGLLQRFKQ